MDCDVNRHVHGYDVVIISRFFIFYWEVGEMINSIESLPGRRIVGHAIVFGFVVLLVLSICTPGVGMLSDSERELLQAVSKSNLEEVKKHLSRGVNVNCRDLRGTTPLMECISSDTGSVELARLL
ncbi:MAG TPA: hypothetical protein PK307_18380, partial [Spirochaetota bacterium]|nr:hypothetical protein [Spirochaetota bacterium]